MEISIANHIHNHVKIYETWMTVANENATLKGHSVLYREKILPALAPNKNFKNNSTEVNVMTEESKKKFLEKWKETQVDTAADDTRRAKILEVVKPLLGSDPNKAVVDIADVKTVVGESKICWGCLRSTCLTSQIISRKMTVKKLQSKVEKDNWGIPEILVPSSFGGVKLKFLL